MNGWKLISVKADMWVIDFLEGINLILAIFTAISHCEDSYNSAQFNHELGTQSFLRELLLIAKLACYLILSFDTTVLLFDEITDVSAQ